MKEAAEKETQCPSDPEEVMHENEMVNSGSEKRKRHLIKPVGAPKTADRDKLPSHTPLRATRTSPLRRCLILDESESQNESLEPAADEHEHNFSVSYKNDCSRKSASVAYELKQTSRSGKTSSLTSQERDENTRRLLPKYSKASAVLKLERRRKVPWSVTEIDQLKRGIEMYGCGNWKYVLQCGKNVFHPKRNAVDLKDKFRNLKKKGLV